MKNYNAKDMPIPENLKRNLDALGVFIENISDKYVISFDEIVNKLKEKKWKERYCNTLLYFKRQKSWCS